MAGRPRSRESRGVDRVANQHDHSAGAAGRGEVEQDRLDRQAQRASTCLRNMLQRLHRLMCRRQPGPRQVYPRSTCATKRSFICPAKRGEIGGISLDPMANPEPKGLAGTIACQETSDRAQAYGVMRWGICMTWRKLDCLKPNLQEAQCARPPERRLKPVPALRQDGWTPAAILRAGSDSQRGN